MVNISSIAMRSDWARFTGALCIVRLRAMRNRSRVTCLVVALGLSLVTIGDARAGVLPRVADGDVRIYQFADASFDQYTSDPSATEESWMRANYARMRTFNPYFDSRLSWYPNAWVYKDAFAIKSTWPIFKTHPEWILKDSAGNKLYIKFGCSGGKCTQYAGDIGNPNFRANWINEARALFAKGYKGMWIDDVNLAWRISNGNGTIVTPINPRTGKLMTLDEWQGYFVTFMNQVRAAFPNVEIGHNTIWYADEFTDPEVLKEIAAADYINMERGATDAGLTGGTGKWSFSRWLSFIDLVHAKGKGVILWDKGTTSQQREFGLAAWFLISTGIDMMSTNQMPWTAPGSFWAGYGLDLGKSLSPRYWKSGLLRRDFACGYVLLNPPGGATVHVALSSSDRRIDGTVGGAVDLAARSAVIIKRSCTTP